MRRGVLVGAFLFLACGSSGSGGTGGATGGDGEGEESAETGGDGDGEGEGSGDGDGDGEGSGDGDGEAEGGTTKFDLGTLPDAYGGCEGGGGGNDDVLSFIWIANSSEGTVSKIDTATGVEEGRYDAHPQTGGNPSRTSVNLLGDVAVSNRDPGGTTKIAAHVENCVDADNDNQITTSGGANDVKAWGEDECVLWHTTTPSSGYGNGPRPTAWEGGKFSQEDCGVDENPRLWIGFKNAQNNGEFWRLDGDTGMPLDQVDVGYWGTGYGPYGGAVNADGDFIVTGLNTDPSKHVDADDLTVTDLGNPAACKYGMGLDQYGDIWVGHCFGEGVSHYSFDDAQWTTIPNSGGTRVNGIQVDRNGSVWGAGSSNCRLVQLDVETKQYVNNNIPLPNGCSSPWGVSIDVEGYVWVVDMGSSKAYKVNPETYQTEITVSGLVGPYTYSDMTGSGLNLVVNPPN
jgi:hypothetical protein